MSNFVKLFKHNAYSLYRILIIFYIVYLILAPITRLTGGLSGDFVALFTKGLVNSLFISAIATLLINNLTRLWARFRASVYGPESYLTHALPIPTKTIWLSWWALGFCSILASCAVIIAALFVAYPDFATVVAEHIGPVASMLGVSSTLLVVQLGLIAFLEIFFIASVGLLAIVLGHKSNQRRGVRSFVYGLIIYGAAQAILLSAIYLLALHNDQIMAIFSNSVITDFNSLTSVLTIASATYSLFIVATGFAAVRALRSGVNVE